MKNGLMGKISYRAEQLQGLTEDEIFENVLQCANRIREREPSCEKSRKSNNV